MADDRVIGACPFCGVVASRSIYDIGDGPELSCSHCEWCWGAEGQDLTSRPIIELQKKAAEYLRAAGYLGADGKATEGPPS